MKSKMILMCAVFSVLSFSSCNPDEEETTDTPATTPTLYTRLGGVDAITAVVDQFLANVVADDVINDQFSATVADPYRTQLLRFNLIDQICAASGGPCQYKGLTMMEAHDGMNITDDEFNALVGDLVAALNTFSVPSAEQTELLTILGSLQPEIVGQ
ncbi:MAG: group I truncated hemoglobin [Flavobacteriales bacterium]